MAGSTKAWANSDFQLPRVVLIGALGLLTAVFFPAPSLAGPAPLPTPTFVPATCELGAGSSAVISTAIAVLNLPLTGTQIWRFGPVEADSTRKLLILPSESHFGCNTTSFVGLSVKICARADQTTYCHGGPNDGLECPPAVCGSGNPCDVNPGQGLVDCAPGGGSVTDYDMLMQIDHDTNVPLIAGKPNMGLPLDPQCTATFTAPDGSVLHACIEPEATNAPTPTTGPGTPTPTPKPSPTARAAAAATCTGPSHAHPNVCNSPAEQTFSGVSEVGGFRLNAAIALSFEIGADCSTPCPPDGAPLQEGDLRIAGRMTSGKAKSIIWNLNNTSQIMGTTGAGNGASICNVVSGGSHTCPTTDVGTPIDLTSLGGDCLADVPATVNGALGVLQVSSLDSPTIGDLLTTLRLQCGSPGPTPPPSSTPTVTPTRTPLGGCPAAPRAGCQQPQRGSSVSLNARSRTAGWKWLAGSTPVDLSQFGDPVNGPTAYLWCLYDTSTGPPSLAFEARVPEGGTCGARPCWKQTHNRFSYSNPAATPDGVTRMTLTGSGGAGASIVVHGRGSNLQLPAADGVFLLREFPEVIVQVQRSDGPGCWEAVFPGPPIHDTRWAFADTVR